MADGRPNAALVGGTGRAIDLPDVVAARRRSGWGKLFDLAVVAVAFAAGAAMLTGYATFRIWDVGRRDDRQPSDAIVVLGAAHYNWTLSPVLAARMDHAIDLYKSGFAPYLVVTGGKQPGDEVTEAASERAYAMNRGVPASAILMEDTGRTTLESIQNVRAVFGQHELHTGLFVSDRSHMLRILQMAADQGIQAHGSPTDTSPADSTFALRLDATAHELGGLALYYLVEQPAAAKAQGAAGMAEPRAAATGDRVGEGAAGDTDAATNVAPPGGAPRQAARAAQLYYRSHVLRRGPHAHQESAFSGRADDGPFQRQGQGGDHG